MLILDIPSYTKVMTRRIGFHHKIQHTIVSLTFSFTMFPLADFQQSN